MEEGVRQCQYLQNQREFNLPSYEALFLPLLAICDSLQFIVQKKTKFSIKDLFSSCEHFLANFLADLFSFTE